MTPEDAAWPLALDDGDDAAAMDAALDMLDGGIFFGCDVPSLLGDADLDMSFGDTLGMENDAHQLSQTRSGDSVTLSTTQAFLEEVDMDVSDAAHSLSASVSRSDGGEDGISTESSDADSASRVAKQTRRSRVRPKEELVMLRKQEYELAAKVRELRVETRRRVAKASSSKASEARSRHQSLLFWERAAVRQFQHRRRSEQENHRLKVMLHTQMRQVRHMQQAWRRRLTTADEVQLIQQQSALAQAIPSDNATVFARLLDDVDETYTHLDAVGASAAQATAPGQGDMSVHLTCGAFEHFPFLEHRQASVVPFPLRQVQSAVWRSFSSLRRLNSGFRRNYVDEVGDVLKTSASKVVSQPMNSFFLRIQGVARKYKEQERAVVVTVTRIEPRGLEKGLPFGVTYFETSVRILTPIGDSVTRVEVRASLRREIADGPYASYWHQGDDDLRAKRMWSMALASRGELLEEFLMDSA